jgi:DNA polymerase delta subunit 3
MWGSFWGIGVVISLLFTGINDVVTKDYDTEESYSGDSEPEPTTKSSSKAKLPPAPAKKAPPPAPSRTTSTTSVESDRKPNITKTASGALKKGTGGQSTLQGFFKKK